MPTTEATESESGTEAREEVEELIRERAAELDGRRDLTPEERAILANRAVHEGPNYVKAFDDALGLMDVLVEIAAMSERLGSTGRAQIDDPARRLVYHIKDALEEAREKVQERVCRYDYALAKIEPASDLSGYALSREEPLIDVSDVEEVRARE